MSDYKEVGDTFERMSATYSFNGSDPYVDPYRYTSYVTADAGNDTHDYDDIPRGSYNTWAFQFFYNDPPTLDIEYDPADCTCSYRTAFPKAQFRIELADGPLEQRNVDVSSPYPNDDDSSSSFGLSLGFGWGPISVGLSKTVLDIDQGDVDFDQVDYHYAEWDIQMGDWWVNWFGDPPDSQENNIGVYFDIDTGEKLQEELVSAKMNTQYYIYRTSGSRSGEELLYSTDKGHSHDISFDVVRPD